MDNKQSSVEWYSVKRDVLEIEVRLGKLSANEYAEELAKAEQQAKAMHKEEIIQTYSNAWHDGQDAIIMKIEHIDKGGDERDLKYYDQL